MIHLGADFDLWLWTLYWRIFKNPNGENEWRKHFLEHPGKSSRWRLHCTGSSFNAALCGRVQVLLQAAVSSASIAIRSPSPSFSGTLTLSFLCSFWVLLSVSLVWLRLKALSVVLSEVCPRLARAQSFSDLFRHIQFTQAQCVVKAMILIQEKREKSLSFSSL